MAVTWSELAGLALARQLPASTPGGVPAMLEAIGPIQSQTARSPFLALAARFPGVTHEDLTAAYESFAVVRGSTLRGTVHSSVAGQHPALDAATRVGQRTLWSRLLKLQSSSLEDLWAATEAFAQDEWRTTDELHEHLVAWLRTHEGPDAADRVASTQGRYLAFGHGGLVRRPLRGSWSGQGTPVYRTASAVVPAAHASIDDAVRLHLRCHGPASRHDVAWWSGLGLRVVDEVLDRLDLVRLGQGPDGRAYVDLPGALEPRSVHGVRLLPEFDALMCGYDPSARVRFADPAHLERLWSGSNGLVLPPLLVEGRITGYWRAVGSSARRPLEVVWFAGTRRPRKAELVGPVAALEAALGITVTSVGLSRETVG